MARHNNKPGPVRYERFMDRDEADKALRRLYIEAADGTEEIYNSISIMDAMQIIMLELGIDPYKLQSRLIQEYPTNMPRGMALSAHLLTVLTLEDLLQNEEVHPDHWPDLDSVDPSYRDNVEAEFNPL